MSRRRIWKETEKKELQDDRKAWLLNDQHKSRNNEESSTAVLGP
jgi:hypothetical protein